jgi:hypothetical protein
MAGIPERFTKLQTSPCKLGISGEIRRHAFDFQIILSHSLKIYAGIECGRGNYKKIALLLTRRLGIGLLISIFDPTSEGFFVNWNGHLIGNSIKTVFHSHQNSAMDVRDSKEI